MHQDPVRKGYELALSHAMQILQAEARKTSNPETLQRLSSCIEELNRRYGYEVLG